MTCIHVGSDTGPQLHPTSSRAIHRSTPLAHHIIYFPTSTSIHTTLFHPPETPSNCDSERRSQQHPARPTSVARQLPYKDLGGHPPNLCTVRPVRSRHAGAHATAPLCHHPPHPDTTSITRLLSNTDTTGRTFNYFTLHGHIPCVCSLVLTSSNTGQ